MRIAYQGEPGAFSEAAALQIKADALLVPCLSFEDVFDSVKAGPAGYGVLPIENSIGGSIHRNFDLLLEHELPIVGTAFGVHVCLKFLEVPRHNNYSPPSSSCK